MRMLIVSRAVPLGVCTTGQRDTMAVAKKALVAVLSLAFVFAVAAPAEAFSVPGAFGTRVRCYNSTVGGSPSGHYWEWELRRLYVTTPVFAPLNPGQTVGRRFIFERKLGDGSWTVRYRSPIQKATASSGGTVTLAPMDVKVALPADPYDAFYRVAVKVYSYRPDGSVKATAKQGVHEYRIWIDGQFRWKQDGYCEGRTGFAV
jgi:hypothetical protein